MKKQANTRRKPASYEIANSGEQIGIDREILTIHGQRVILDASLARLYGAPTKRLNEQVKRNRDRFAPDFVFELTPDEKMEVVANCDQLTKLKFSPATPYAFTEHGAIMAATVLNSPRAVQISVFVVRACVDQKISRALWPTVISSLKNLAIILCGDSWDCAWRRLA